MSDLRSVLGPALPITVVVGYRAEKVMQAAPDLLFAYNEAHATTSTSRSLLEALVAAPPGGVLWLNGDVAFDPHLLHELRPHLDAGTSAVCLNTAAVGEEEVEDTVDGHGYVAQLSKTVVGGLGEAVGISRYAAVEVDVEEDLARARSVHPAA